MTKHERIKAVAEKAGITHAQADCAIDALLDCIIQELKAEKTCNLVRFGTFSIVHRNERVGHNMCTGGTFIIPERDAIKFKPSKDLKAQF